MWHSQHRRMVLWESEHGGCGWVCVCVFFNETMNKQVAKVRATIHIKKKSNLYIRGAYSFPAFRAFGWNEASNARSHKSHWGNSHYLLFNRFADTDCAWILLDYGQPKIFTTIKTSGWNRRFRQQSAWWFFGMMKGKKYTHGIHQHQQQWNSTRKWLLI